ncbi:hypothetical protein [Beutenbergia cavernae]|uniref:hypothetical protein n=1 Tax=Beutenbergia cavernae TaxID=84757 RepID=UPI00019ACD55|nr:hypothetical protein [Beutenbergia cavernae]
MISARELLAGPRGRRLCLELATAVRDDDGGLAVAASAAAFALDPGAGTSRVRLTAVSDGSDPSEHEVPTPSPAEVAGLFRGTPTPSPTEADLLVALRDAVDVARYWQEPDGEDVLAATPDVREALLPTAQAVVSAPHAAWWTTPIERSAQLVATLDARDSQIYAPFTGAVVDHLATWRAETAQAEERAAREYPRDVRASFSGSWWSIPPHALTGSTRALGSSGPAGLWFVEDRFDDGAATVRAVAVPPQARVYEITGPDAWADLCRRHPLDVTACRRHDWFRTTGRDGAWVIPDWAAVGREYDGVHLTVAGYLTTAGRAVPVDGAASVLAGWDADRTVWLTDVAVTGEPQTWGAARPRDLDPHRRLSPPLDGPDRARLVAQPRSASMAVATASSTGVVPPTRSHW